MSNCNKVQGKYCEYEYELKNKYIHFYPIIPGIARLEYSYENEVKNKDTMGEQLKVMLNTNFVGDDWDDIIYHDAIWVSKRYG